jgi:hypothetical protein
MANHTKETIGLIRDCGGAATNELVHRIEKGFPNWHVWTTVSNPK